MRTVIIFLTHKSDEKILEQINKLHCEVMYNADFYVGYQFDKTRLNLPINIKKIPFTIEDLNSLGYYSWNYSLMDGNMHLILLKFFETHPQYDYYWLIEYDVRFNGNWETFFTYFERENADFASAHIETYSENPSWPRWNEYDIVNLPINKGDLLKSFNPIFRVSNKALSLLKTRALLGDKGHFEILLPTIFNYFNLKIIDFGGVGRYSNKQLPNLFYVNSYSICTHRFRPLFQERTMVIPNMIYHPVK